MALFSTFYTGTLIALHSFKCSGLNIASHLKQFWLSSLYPNVSFLCWYYSLHSVPSWYLVISTFRIIAEVTSLLQMSFSNWIVSSTVLFGSVHSFCCTHLLALFTINTSFTCLSVIPLKLHFDAIEFDTFQNCLSVSPSSYLGLRNLNRSRVSFFGFPKQSFHVFIESVSVILAIFTLGKLQAMVFLVAIPKAKQRSLIAFFVAFVSSMPPLRHFAQMSVVSVNSAVEFGTISIIRSTTWCYRVK